MIWKVRYYVTEAGDCPMAKWVAGLSDEVRAVFDQQVYAIARMRNWKDRWQIRELERTHKGLWEVRFNVGKGQSEIKYRPVGAMTTDARIFREGEFVFLNGCTKQFGHYSPPSAFDDALDLKCQMESGKGGTRDAF